MHSEKKKVYQRNSGEEKGRWRAAEWKWTEYEGRLRDKDVDS